MSIPIQSDDSVLPQTSKNLEESNKNGRKHKTAKRKNRVFGMRFFRCGRQIRRMKNLFMIGRNKLWKRRFSFLRLVFCLCSSVSLFENV
jgi:hypothetical protein